MLRPAPTLLRRNLKTVSVHFENAPNRRSFKFVLEDINLGIKSNDPNFIVFAILHFRLFFPSTRNRKAGIFKLNFSALKNVFERLSIRGGLVWSVDITVEINYVFKLL